MALERRVLIGLLFLLSGGFLGSAAYIPAKAWLAQRLLERAWYLGQSGPAIPAPWPWADTRPIMRLTQPRLGVSQFVLEGASGRVLAFGPGWLTVSAVPGEYGNVVVSGHRDTHFRWLAELRHADILTTVLSDGRRKSYRVSTMQIHHADEVGLADPHIGDQLRLVTCYPLDAINAGTEWRYVVTALPEPNAAS